jgi:hypothetical protein
LLATIWLREQHIVELHAERACVARIECVLGIDEGGYAALPLCLGDGVQAERGLAARFRAEDLDDAAAWISADAEGGVERDRAGGNAGNTLLGTLFAERHDGALAEAFFDVADELFEFLSGFVAHGCTSLVVVG